MEKFKDYVSYLIVTSVILFIVYVVIVCSIYVFSDSLSLIFLGLSLCVSLFIASIIWSFDRVSKIIWKE